MRFFNSFKKHLFFFAVFLTVSAASIYSMPIAVSSAEINLTNIYLDPEFQGAPWITTMFSTNNGRARASHAENYENMEWSSTENGPLFAGVDGASSYAGLTDTKMQSYSSAFGIDHQISSSNSFWSLDCDINVLNLTQFSADVDAMLTVSIQTLEPHDRALGGSKVELYLMQVDENDIATRLDYSVASIGRVLEDSAFYYDSGISKTHVSYAFNSPYNGRLRLNCQISTFASAVPEPSDLNLLLCGFLGLLSLNTFAKRSSQKKTIRFL